MTKPDIIAALRHHINNDMDQFDLWKLKDTFGNTVFVSIAYHPGERPPEAFDDLDAAPHPREEP